MFTSFLDTNNALLVNRLARILPKIQAEKPATREDYAALLTSLVNGVINADYQMQGLVRITSQTPAVVGDVVENLLRLNQDYSDVADEISRLEDNASVLYNLAAAVENALRQSVREGIYASTSKSFVEAFVNKAQIADATASLDFVAGRAGGALISETELSPTLEVGKNSIGTTDDDVNAMLSGRATNLFTLNGDLLELIVTFPVPTIVNRMKVTPDDYRGYEITSFSTSADGSQYSDVLSDLKVPVITMNAASGKYSGATIVDFPPRSVSSARIVFENRVDSTKIALRSLAFLQRSYQASGSLTSTSQTTPTGDVSFVVDQTVFSPYVSVTHQISSDGINFRTIQPGDVTLPVRWWYRALFSRSSAAFTSNSPAVWPTSADPNYSVGFTLKSSSSTAVSPTTIERKLVFENITGPIPLREAPILGTLVLNQGTVYLTEEQYALSSDNVLSFPSTVSSVVVTYQTSAQGAANLPALQPYFSAFLNQVSFLKS